MANSAYDSFIYSVSLFYQPPIASTSSSSSGNRSECISRHRVIKLWLKTQSHPINLMGKGDFFRFLTSKVGQFNLCFGATETLPSLKRCLPFMTKISMPRILRPASPLGIPSDGWLSSHNEVYLRRGSNLDKNAPITSVGRYPLSYHEDITNT